MSLRKNMKKSLGLLFATMFVMNMIFGCQGIVYAATTASTTVNGSISGKLLKTHSRKLFILDFDTSCYAFPTYDIMIMCNTTNYFDFDENGYHSAKNTYETFLKGYTRYNALSDTELRAFNDFIAIYHYQLQATIIEIYGLNCEKFLDKQLDWLMRWREQCEIVK